MKPQLLIFILVVAAFVAYMRAPGLKAKVDNLANEWGGWTEEAIDNDPVKFIEYAQEKLQENLEQFEESKGALASSKKTAEDRLASFTSELENADALAVEFRTAFQSAKATGAFPVKLVNQDYTESQVVEQVQQLLTTKKNAQARIADYQSILARVAEKESELIDRISLTGAKIQELDAQKEMVKLDQLTAEADALLAQVNEVVTENGKALKSEDANPVRSVADLMKDLESKSSDDTPEPASDAMAFLTGN